MGESVASTIAERLAEVRRRILEAAERAGRDPMGVRLIAVSKGHGVDALRAAMSAGQHAFGENYVQEWMRKREELSNNKSEIPSNVEWHFIGRVQRNKASALAEATLVHGVGDVRHLRALGEQRAGRPPLDVLWQVNAAGEVQKNGFAPEALTAEAKRLAAVPGVRLRGLMVLPPRGGTREIFQEVARLRDTLEGKLGFALPELSMGMSGDFEHAIAAGATLVRIGTAIFGERPVARASGEEGA